MGGIINLVNNFKVKKVIFDCGEFNDLELDLIKFLDNLNNLKIYRKIKMKCCIKIKNDKLRIEIRYNYMLLLI